jgi:hypothetical protein
MGPRFRGGDTVFAGLKVPIVSRRFPLFPVGAAR